MNYTDFSEDERKFYLSESGFDSRADMLSANLCEKTAEQTRSLAESYATGFQIAP